MRPYLREAETKGGMGDDSIEGIDYLKAGRFSNNSISFKTAKKSLLSSPTDLDMLRGKQTYENETRTKTVFEYGRKTTSVVTRKRETKTV